MDTQEYISSGILESVVLGFASEQEVREVSCLSVIYPEIREEFVAIELSVEKMAFNTAVEPSSDIKKTLLERIANEPQIQMDSTASTNSSSKSATSTVSTSSTNEVTEGKIITMNAPNPWKWAAAASILLCVGIGALWMNSNAKSNELSTQIATLTDKNTDNGQVLAALQLEQERANAIQAVVTEESAKNINMAGTAYEPKATVRVIWSANGKKAVMVANTIAPPPTNHQYQLWAIANGKPVSLGVFTHDEVVNMTEPFEVNATNISAFAITLEKTGGSPTGQPTMERMVVLGSV